MEIFKAEDFEGTIDLIGVASAANAILQKWLDEAPEVYCRKDADKWACDEHPGFARTTHKAKLVCIEELQRGE